MLKDLSVEEAAAKEEFIGSRGFWHDSLEPLLRISPDFFRAHIKYSAIPWGRGRIDAKTKEFIYIALDANATHLYEPGLRLHLQNAIRYGATLDELKQVLQLLGLKGLNTLTAGLAIVLEELHREIRGKATADDAGREELKQRYANATRQWPPQLEGWLALDPDFLAALTRLSEVATATRTLPVKTMAFIRLAADISTTGIFEPAARLHVRTAVEHGATVEELLEVLQLVSVVGLHACTFGGPILFDEWEKSLALEERSRTGV